MSIAIKFLSVGPRTICLSQPAKLTAALVFLALSFCVVFPNDAGATRKIDSPIVERGELEVEIKGSVDFDDDDAKDNKQKQKYGMGYGVTDWWFTEVEGELEKEPNGDFDFEAVAWENRFQLSEQGEYWVDLGLLLAYEAGVEDDKADKIEAKLLLEKSFERWAHRLNLALEKETGGGPTEQLESGLAWGTRYRWKEFLEPGFEWHSDFGAFRDRNSFDEGIHFLGPVFYGTVFGHLKYDVGYLFGLSEAAPDGELKWILEYGFEF